MLGEWMIIMGFSIRRSICRAALPALISGLALSLAAVAARAETATVAVAANFTDTANELGALFEKTSGEKINLSFGATGQFYTQISQGAPFDVFLSADQERPKKALAEGYAVPGTDFTYATGKIVLFSTDRDLVKGPETLKTAAFDKIAIANPATAPYGAASVETMRALGVYEILTPKIVQGENISQTFQFVQTGNAHLGFVALSQVVGKNEGSRWIVPEKLYSTIAQDAVLLKHGENNKAARAFLKFLKSPQARTIMEKYGYGAGTR
jgi:molybdate transport system substrate-binding protein